MQDTESIALVRAFGDEPWKLRAICDGDDGSVRVFGPHGDESIPYPIAFVFEFEDQLFADLVAAYRNGDTSRLTALWSRARPITH